MESKTLTHNTAQTLAELIENQTYERFMKEFGRTDIHYESAIKTTVKPGKKYTKIDVGTSGKYMIDEKGDIYGIKAYGVIHHGHYYGNLETINNYDWSGYTARKI